MTKNRKIVLIVIIALLLAGAVTAWLVYRHHQYKVKTTSTSATAQNNYSSGGNRPTGSSSDNSQGGATDTHGGDTPQPPSNPRTSTSGVIAVFQPTSDGTLASGAPISGTAKGLSSVQYRLVDAEAGLIAQGTLDVVNDNYSGTLRFTPKGTSGKLDVFSFDSTGKEINGVEIPVQLKE